MNLRLPYNMSKKYMEEKKMRKLFKRAAALTLAVLMLVPAFAACKNTSVKKLTTPLVVGYSAFSQKFSPFFAKTGYDQDVADMVSISLMTTDRALRRNHL